MNKGDVFYSTFDIELYPVISKYHWRMSTKKNKKYVCSGQNKNGKKIIYMHNLIMDYIPIRGIEVDHIDGNSLNNRKSNLRLVGRINNIHNTRERQDNTSGIRGVSFNKRYEAYVVDFYCDKKRFYFKQFKKQEEAVYLRLLCEQKFWGEYRYVGNDKKIFDYIGKLSQDQKNDIEEYFVRITSEIK